jgi:hypothetical protein
VNIEQRHQKRKYTESLVCKYYILPVIRRADRYQTPERGNALSQKMRKVRVAYIRYYNYYYDKCTFHPNATIPDILTHEQPRTSQFVR